MVGVSHPFLTPLSPSSVSDAILLHAFLPLPTALSLHTPHLSPHTKVHQLSPGDRVMSPFTTSCGTCFYCCKGMCVYCCSGQRLPPVPSPCLSPGPLPRAHTHTHAAAWHIGDLLAVPHKRGPALPAQQHCVHQCCAVLCCAARRHLPLQ